MSLPPSHPNRFAALDGLRGVAIGMVVLFHAYARWPELVPYGDRYADLVVTKYGHLGVQLFFLISGFVILMTLERTKSYADFLGKRWLRLFPAMAICTILIVLTAPLLPERPSGMPSLRDTLPGLTLIEPNCWAWLLGPPTNGGEGVLEGTFWSLFVECKFYVVAGALYFMWGARRTVIALMALAVLFRVLVVADKLGVVPAMAMMIADAVSLKHTGWFAAGAALYLAWSSDRSDRNVPKTSPWLWSGVATILLMSVKPSAPTESLVGLGIGGIFVAALTSQRGQRLLTTRTLLIVGAASYPLYLLHENAMIALIAKSGRLLDATPLASLTPLLPFGAIAILLAIATIVATYGEPFVRRMLRTFPTRLQTLRAAFRRTRTRSASIQDAAG